MNSQLEKELFNDTNEARLNHLKCLTYNVIGRFDQIISHIGTTIYKVSLLI